MAASGAVRAKKLRDKERDQGIEKVISKMTATERAWIQQGQDKHGYEDATEYWLALVRADLDNTVIVTHNKRVIQ